MRRRRRFARTSRHLQEFSGRRGWQTRGGDDGAEVQARRPARSATRRRARRSVRTASDRQGFARTRPAGADRAAAVPSGGHRSATPHSVEKPGRPALQPAHGAG